MKDVIKYLRALAKGTVVYPYFQGICGSLCIFCPTITRIKLELIFRSWPKFSGDPLYPVPCPNESPVRAYNNKPLWSGKYGDNRKKLCRHIANELAYVMYLQEILAVVRKHPHTPFICMAITDIRAPQKHSTRLYNRVQLALNGKANLLPSLDGETRLQACERFLNNLIKEILP